jgi:hypothetical protein
MRLSLLLFIIGVLFITAGYAQSVSPKCEKGSEVRIVPRNVYDQIIADSTL